NGLLRRWSEDPQTTAALLGAVQNTNALVRLTAVRSLEPALVTSPVVKAAMERLLNDTDRAIRVEAAWALHETLDTNSTAGRELLDYLRQNLDQPTGQLQMGTFFLDRNQPQPALEHLQRAVSWDTNSAPLHHALAVAFSVTGKPQEAVRAMRDACRLAPREAEYRFKLALALNEVGKLNEAVPEFENAVQLSPQFVQAWYNLGLAYAALHKPELALEKLSRAEALNPTAPQFPYARATILAQTSRLNEARKAALRVLEIQPTHAEAAALLQQLDAMPSSNR
ncbi:MAG: Tetratricopeptide repeat protein, partial [Verrucomicrobiales bacterium]|nr:Tetratricopeptide repeat protein [Verrucomicrobiales bacterium]